MAVSPTAGELIALLRHQHGTIRNLLNFAAGFGALLRGRAHAAVPCHGDLHAANVLLHGWRVHIVDWDDPLLAPRERDLMFIGAGVCGVWKDNHETSAFHHGYGPVEQDPALLGYYRCERIVEISASPFGEFSTKPATLLRQIWVSEATRSAVRAGRRGRDCDQTAKDASAA